MEIKRAMSDTPRTDAYGETEMMSRPLTCSDEEWKHFYTVLQGWAALCRQLESELAARPEGNAIDAERYRWLRKFEWDLIILPQFVGHPEEDGHEYASSPEQLDAAIDAVRSPQKTP